MKLKYKRGENFNLPEEFWHGILTKWEEFESDKGYVGVKYFFDILEDEDLEVGEGSTRGKNLNILFWSNGEEDGEPTFPESGKKRNTDDALISWFEDKKKIEEIDDLIGGVVRFSTKNEKAKDTNSDAVFSKIQDTTISAIKPEKRNKVLDLLDEYYEWKEKNANDEKKEKTSKSKSSSKDSRNSRDDEERSSRSSRNSRDDEERSSRDREKNGGKSDRGRDRDNSRDDDEREERNSSRSRRSREDLEKDDPFKD